jgi:hypothetical protein
MPTSARVTHPGCVVSNAVIVIVVIALDRVVILLLKAIGRYEGQSAIFERGVSSVLERELLPVLLDDTPTPNHMVGDPNPM